MILSVPSQPDSQTYAGLRAMLSFNVQVLAEGGVIERRMSAGVVWSQEDCAANSKSALGLGSS